MAIAFDTDGGSGSRARLGLVVLQSDETMEPELARLSTELPGVALHHTRIPSGEHVNTETLSAMHEELPGVVSLLPKGSRFDCIGYGCTSGATVIGEQAVTDAIQTVLPDVAVTNPLSGLKAACDEMRIGTLGLVTPYEREVTDLMAANLRANGIHVSSVQSFEQTSEHIVARITTESVLAALTEATRVAPPCDGWFVSCTNLRMAAITDRAESALGKPVLSSNQVLAWHMMRRAGLNDTLNHWGSLLRQPPRGAAA